jgi:hypothetical protein
MDPESKQIAQETFNALPKDIQEVVFSDDYQRILSEIAEKYNLNENQAKKFEFETTMVLMGIITRAYYPFNLETELEIDEDTAQNIANDITDTVFAEVWKLLDEMDVKNNNEQSLLEEAPQTETVQENSGVVSPLASLADRLKKASIAAPAKRDSEGAAVSSVPSAIDPYHESIDNGK